VSTKRAISNPRRGGSFLAMVAVLALDMTGASAAEGRIPIFQPTVITQSGSYILTADIAAPGTIISVTAPEVTLDLNGHTLTTTTTDFSSTAILLDQGAQDARILGGKIAGGFWGILSMVEMHSAVIERMTFEGMAQGIGVNATQYVEVTGCTMRGTGAGSTAIHARTALGVPVAIRIEGNTLDGWETGVELGGAGMIVKDNEIHLATSTNNFGIHLSPLDTSHRGSLIEGNRISASGQSIENSTPESLLRNNVLINSGDGAVVLFGDFDYLANNTISGAVGGSPSHSGALIKGARALVDGNVVESASGPSGCGITFYGTASVEGAYRDNMLRNNAGGSVCVSGGATATDAGGNIQ
jgi:copper-binding protein NosD